MAVRAGEQVGGNIAHAYVVKVTCYAKWFLVSLSAKITGIFPPDVQKNRYYSDRYFYADPNFSPDSHVYINVMQIYKSTLYLKVKVLAYFSLEL